MATKNYCFLYPVRTCQSLSMPIWALMGLSYAKHFLACNLSLWICQFLFLSLSVLILPSLCLYELHYVVLRVLMPFWAYYWRPEPVHACSSIFKPFCKFQCLLKHIPVYLPVWALQCCLLGACLIIFQACLNLSMPFNACLCPSMHIPSYCADSLNAYLSLHGS